MARLSWSSGPVQSRRAQRREAVRLLRAGGLYGPRFREVLPALVLVVAVVCAVVALLAWGYRAVGIAIPITGVVAVVGAVALWMRRRRPGARRRIGYYTPDDLLELDTQGLALAVARMLRRDGWRVRLIPAPDRPHVRARNTDGCHLDVAFRPVAEPLPDEEPPRPRAHRGKADDDILRVVVHRGTFAARDVQWARRDGRTRLLDGSALRRWGAGEELGVLLAEEG
ncbi:hypothetical protein STRCI_007750 [Streptomyces cinnabarinus]|uniref:Restriction endonuclease n=1 Tax=Streptomyces cinnabarinus TaxID=67287 RepID=A0ABY7KSX6_9ACTN|nr:hypothetical protein [Streptomyces cinnabarinus]WAZ26197.1 hypothetical protein STRCI_007750 [Streptomyces cinnabarinus]